MEVVEAQMREGMRLAAAARGVSLRGLALTGLPRAASCLALVRVLDVAENGLTSLAPLGGLPCLVVLDASGNALADGPALLPPPGCWPRLATLHLHNNRTYEERAFDRRVGSDTRGWAQAWPMLPPWRR
jgi:hypothetical protein